MKKQENNLRAEINKRIYSQMDEIGGLSVLYGRLKSVGWNTPQPLYNVRNGEANLTVTTLRDIGNVDENFSADIAIFGEYRYPKNLKSVQDKLNLAEAQLQKEYEEKRKAEIRAERAEGLIEVLQNALKVSLKTNGANFQTGNIEEQLADEQLEKSKVQDFYIKKEKDSSNFKDVDINNHLADRLEEFNQLGDVRKNFWTSHLKKVDFFCLKTY